MANEFRSSAINYKPIQRTNIKSQPDHRVYPTQLETQSLGGLLVNVTSAKDNKPIQGAKVSVTYTGDPTNNALEELTTNEFGKSDTVQVPAPPLDYSQHQSAQQPYAAYTLTFTAPGFETVVITGAQVLPTVHAIQHLSMIPMMQNVRAHA